MHLVLTPSEEIEGLPAAAVIPWGVVVHVGQAGDNELRIEHPSVGAHSAVLAFRGERCAVGIHPQVSQGAGHIFLNGELVTVLCSIEEGDQLRIGKVTFQAHYVTKE
jgi:hypothetical protein